MKAEDLLHAAMDVCHETAMGGQCARQNAANLKNRIDTFLQGERNARILSCRHCFGSKKDTSYVGPGPIPPCPECSEPRMQEWRPIEMAPKDGSQVLGWGYARGDYGYTEDEYRAYRIRWVPGDGWCVIECRPRYFNGFQPTLFVALPNLPEPPQ